MISRNTVSPRTELTPDESQSYGLNLDYEISLAQELNLIQDAGNLCEKAESGALSPLAPPSSADALQPEELLAMAVITQAVEDWRQATEALRHQKDYPEMFFLRKDAEDFFRSRWFQLLSDLDGEELLSRLQAQARIDGQPAAKPTSLSALKSQTRRLAKKKNRIQAARNNSAHSARRGVPSPGALEDAGT